MNREQVLKEARTNEAMEKGYMGLDGKFAFIAKYLGQPMYQQGSPLFSQTFLEDPFAEEEEILTMDEDEDSYLIGLHFDGLSSGLNMSILVYTDTREITCRFNGSIVYREAAGELEGYAPKKEWEDKLMDLYSICLKKEKRQRPEKRQKLIEDANKERKRKLDELRERWGLE